MGKKKEKKPNIRDKRIALRDFYEKEFDCLITIAMIENKSILDPGRQFDDLYRLLTDPYFLIQAMGNLRTKKGALTPGPSIDPSTIDGSSMENINQLITSLKDGTFRFKPIKRIFIDKTGKNPKLNQQIQKLYRQKTLTPEKIKELNARPLGIPSFNDKIVQEAIRIILNAIYEPNFDKLNSNFGFRPNFGVHDAIRSIQQKAKSMSFAIEADIQGAFDNVNFDILINILRKKIKDEKFLKLILHSLKCGINFSTQFEESKLGTTQGSVLSPILYNIYFHEFDKYIQEQFKETINQININEDRKEKPFNSYYNKIRKLKYKQKYKEYKELLNEIFTTYGKDSDEYRHTKALYIESLKNHISLDKLQKTMTPITVSKQTIRYHYVRYADDWILFTNASQEKTIYFKEIFSDWITQNLKLKLSDSKTVVTDLKKSKAGKAHFLGFQLCYYSNKRILKIGKTIKLKLNPINRKKITLIKKSTNRIDFSQRTTNPTLIAAIDRKRVLSRLELKRFIKFKKGTWTGCRKPEWTILTIPEIIERYNYMIRGYLNFYGPMTLYPNDVAQIHYLLKYSCMHTLASKLRTSLRGIIKKFGKDINITWEVNSKHNKNYISSKESVQEESGTFETGLITWSESKEIISQAIVNSRKRFLAKKPLFNFNLLFENVDDLSNININWRTVHKLTQHCCICGSTSQLEYHHVKHIRVGKTTGFLQVMNQLNRKQIPCCKSCHNKIHAGTYDDMKLTDLYDSELVIL